MNIKSSTFQNKSVIVYVCFVLFIVCLYICVCKCLLQNNNNKPNIKIIPIGGVPSSQALPGFLITAPSSVCVPEVIGVLAVWISNQKKNAKTKQHTMIHCPIRNKKAQTLVCVSDVIGVLAVWRYNKPKTKNQSGQKPLVVNGVSCWVRLKRNRRGSV